MRSGPTLLSVHAVDNFGEEGIIADSSVSSELGCRPVGVVTAVLTTAARSVEALESLSLSMIAQQFEALTSQARPAVTRTGIIKGARHVELAASLLHNRAGGDVVVAPVLKIAGTRILDQESLDATRRFLFPLARLVIVRASDMQALTGESVEDIEGMKRAAESVRSQGAPAVLVAGVVSRGRVLDLLDDEGRIGLFDASRVRAPRVCGLSGAHAAALACYLALGQSLPRAVDAAQRYVAFRLQRGR